MFPPENCFTSVMSALDAAGFEASQQDLWSKTCVEQFRARPDGAYGYCFGQVFEPYVLREVADSSGQGLDPLERLEVGDGDLLAEFRGFVADASDADIISQVNAAAALLSISRFDRALDILAKIPVNTCSSRDLFEIASLKFIISNRLGQPFGMKDCYRVIKRAIQVGGVPDSRAITAASTAVVWNIKQAFLDPEDYAWFEELGESLAQKRQGVDAGALSAWYRGVAMVPAAKGDRELTRQYMRAASQAADEAIATRHTFYEQNLRKTYLESTLKEHMYVTRDYDAACEVGRDLIAYDPIWSVSHGEVAECFAFFKKHEEAATAFERAAMYGPPYYGHHLFNAAQNWEVVGNKERAMAIYESLLDLDGANSSVIVAGTRLARRTGVNSKARFDAALEALPHLSKGQIRYLHGIA